MVNECSSSPPCRFTHLILFCKGEAQRKFGNAKSISSDQFHGNQDRVSILNHLTYISKLDVYNIIQNTVVITYIEIEVVVVYCSRYNNNKCIIVCLMM